jgi:Ser/Thr protein kinase RdoA (MazF antagonist)
VGRPGPTVAGALTVTVHTELAPIPAMWAAAAPGAAVELEELGEERARVWGRNLAGLHRNAASVHDGLPVAFGELAEIERRFPEDATLLKAVARLADWRAALPRDAARYGVVHGDYELDNMAWDGERAVAYDFDEAALSWYAADVAFALRDLTDARGYPTPEREVLVDAFIEGYRSVRPIGEDELALLPVLAGLNAAVSLVRIARATEDARDDEPEWLADLRGDLAEMADAHRAQVIAAADLLDGGTPGLARD